MRPDLKQIFKSFKPGFLLLPICTIIGTLTFTYLATIFFREETVGDVMAVGSGFGYYSLSSVLISQFKEATVGP